MAARRNPRKADLESPRLVRAPGVHLGAPKPSPEQQRRQLETQRRLQEALKHGQ